MNLLEMPDNQLPESWELRNSCLSRLIHQAAFLYYHLIKNGLLELPNHDCRLEPVVRQHNKVETYDGAKLLPSGLSLRVDKHQGPTVSLEGTSPMI